jgi:hypothetical protein
VKEGERGRQHTCTTCHPPPPPRDAKRRSAATATTADATAANAEDAAEDDDEFSPVFKIKCGAMLLTWNYSDPETPRPSLDVFKTFLMDKGAERISLCFERGTCDHAHAFIEGKKWDCTVKAFEVGSVTPNVQPNKGKGLGARTTKDRGHFYVVFKFKDTHQESWTNYEPSHDYGVKTMWVQSLYQQQKVTRATECAAHYHCLTPALDALVRLSDGKRRAAEKAMAREEREKRLRDALVPFAVPPAVAEWKYPPRGGREPS